MKSNTIKRLILFLIGCMGTRFGLSFFIKNHGIKYKNILIVLLLALSFGFMYIYMNDLRQTGLEVFGDKIWWNQLRPLHAILYFTSAIMLYLNNKNAYIPLALDTGIGLCSFIIYHITK